MAPRRRHSVARDIADAFAEHNLLTYAAAIAFQGLVALIPLTLLGLGLLGAAGRQDVWTRDIAPKIEGRVTPAVFHAVDTTARKVLDHATPGLIVFAALLSAWYLAAAVRAVMEALNQIHDVKDQRPWWLRALISLGLGVATGAGLIGSAVLVISGPGAGGVAELFLGLGRWILAVLLLGLVVGLLVRFAPAERPEARWASAGAMLVVGSWIVASLIFGVWITEVANFKTPVGSLAGLLVLTGYLFVSSIVFLVGVQLDELLRKETGGRARGVVGLVRGR